MANIGFVFICGGEFCLKWSDYFGLLLVKYFLWDLTEFVLGENILCPVCKSNFLEVVKIN